MLDIISDGIVATLGSSMPYLKTCASYAGELDPAELTRLRTFPAALVFIDGIGFDQVTDQRVVPLLDLIVVVIARSLRGSDSPRKNVAGDTGVYQMVDDAVDALQSYTSDGRIIGGCVPVRAEALASTAQYAIYAVRFSARTTGE